MKKKVRTVLVFLSLGALVGLVINRVMSCSFVQVYGVDELSAAQVAIPDGKQSIVFVGDIMTWDATEPYLERYGVNYPFEATAPLLQTATLTVGNLEGPIAVDAEPVKARYPYKVPPWTLAGLKWAGFDVVNLANNHPMDCREAGLLETFHYLDQAKLTYFGAGRNLPEARQPRIVRLGDLKIAFCGLVAGETYFHEHSDSLVPGGYERMQALLTAKLGARNDRPGTIIATEQSVVQMVRQARRIADLVVLFIHWGIRYHRPPTEFQKRVGHAAIDAGADIIVGHHAHFWQPVERYRGRPIIYGLGNFAFGSGNRRANEGLLARAILAAGRLREVQLYPLYIKNRDSKIRFQSKVMKGASADGLLHRLAELSNAPLAIANGRAVLLVQDMK